MDANEFRTCSKKDDNFNDLINFVVEVMQQHPITAALSLFEDTLKDVAQHVVWGGNLIEIFDGVGGRILYFKFTDED